MRDKTLVKTGGDQIFSNTRWRGGRGYLKREGSKMDCVNGQKH
jgi:hypothetical protein